MASRIFALIIWAAVAASLAYWGLRWLARPTSVPANAPSVSLDGGVQGDMHRLLAGPAQPASGVPNPGESSALAARLKLLGVVAPRQDGGSGGVALLSIDGKPPRAVRIGDTVDGEMVLQALTQRGAAIGPVNGAVALQLDLPLMAAPATGALPPVASLAPQPGTMGGPPLQAGMQTGAQAGMQLPRAMPQQFASGRLSSPESPEPPDRPSPRE